MFSFQFHSFGTEPGKSYPRNFRLLYSLHPSLGSSLGNPPPFAEKHLQKAPLKQRNAPAFYLSRGIRFTNVKI